MPCSEGTSGLPAQAKLKPYPGQNCLDESGVGVFFQDVPNHILPWETRFCPSKLHSKGQMILLGSHEVCVYKGFLPKESNPKTESMATTHPFSKCVRNPHQQNLWSPQQTYPIPFPLRVYNGVSKNSSITLSWKIAFLNLPPFFFFQGNFPSHCQVLHFFYSFPIVLLLIVTLLFSILFYYSLYHRLQGYSILLYYKPQYLHLTYLTWYYWPIRKTLFF